MSWAEAKWTVDSLLQKIGQAPNNMRSFIAYSLSATSSSKTPPTAMTRTTI